MTTTLKRVEGVALSNRSRLGLVVDLTAGRADAVGIVSDAVFNGVPARQVASRSARSVLPTVSSNKMSALFFAESFGEEHVLTLADVLEDVVAFRAQPIEVRWHDGVSVRRSYPDVGLVMVDGSVELWECKPRNKDAALARRLKPLSEKLAEHGVGYRVRTPSWFEAQPRLTNAQRLARQGDRPVRPQLREAVGRLFQTTKSLTLGQLRQALGLDMAELLGAAACGVFAVNIDDRALGDASPVRPTRAGARSGAFLKQGPSTMTTAERGGIAAF